MDTIVGKLPESERAWWAAGHRVTESRTRLSHRAAVKTDEGVQTRRGQAQERSASCVHPRDSTKTGTAPTPPGREGTASRENRAPTS